MNKKLQRFKYILFDYLTAIISWSFFFYYRKKNLTGLNYQKLIEYFDDPVFLHGIILIPLFWLFLYYTSGYYNNIYRKSRLHELAQTILITFIGVIVIFFTSILDDDIPTYKLYYLSFITLFSIHFFCTYLPRLIITSISNGLIQKGKIAFNTIIIGSNERALDTFNEIKNQKKSSGNHIIGFVSTKTNHASILAQHINHLGSIDNVREIIHKHKIEEVIIAVDSKAHEEITGIISLLNINRVTINVIPDLYDIVTGSVKMLNIYGTPFIQVSSNMMPEWQKSTKQFIDIIGAIVALMLTLPLSLFLAVVIKLTSKGPVFYSHTRIGKHGKPFKIIKFRSMKVNAETNGPELASRDDKRITSIGRMMRKMRFDEIPNFINVLKGDMSLVGPRPERPFFIEQIIKRAPQYIHLQKVKPGITSLGQVKFGYAENVDQMIKRLRYDLIYVENMSLFLDFKIMIYTIITIIRGYGI